MQQGKREVKSAPQAQRPHDGKERRIIRIADTDLDGSNKVKDALRSITGISFSFSNAIMKTLKIEDSKKLQDLDEKSISELKELIKDPHKFKIPAWLYNWRKDQTTGLDYHLLSNDLKSKITMNIQSIKSSRSYRGYRHSFNYKMRGQRVRSRGANFRGRVGGTIGVSRAKVQQQKAGAAVEKK